MKAENLFGWIEIPVNDMERAIGFYNEVFGFELQSMAFQDTLMAWFPSDHENYGASGTLIQNKEFYAPSEMAGPLVYMNCETINPLLEKIKLAGGKVLRERTKISEDHGSYALFLDIEGNRLALHSQE